MIDAIFELNEEVEQAREDGKLDDGPTVSSLTKKVKKKLKQLSPPPSTLRDGNKFVVPLPYTVTYEMTRILEELMDLLRTSSRVISRGSMEEELRAAAEEQEGNAFLAAMLSDTESAFNKMSKLAQPYSGATPLLVMVQTPGKVLTRVEVPEDKVTDAFDATKWGEAFAKCLGGEAKAPKGQNPRLVCNVNVVKSKKGSDAKKMMEDAFEEGKRFASMHLE